MVDLESFKEKIRLHFDKYLLNYSYSFLMAETISTMHFVNYVNANRIISIQLAYRHNYIDVRFYYEIVNYSKIIDSSSNDYISLPLLIKYEKNETYNYELDYNNFMPSQMGLDSSIEKLKELLELYGKKVLEGQKITAKEIN